MYSTLPPELNEAENSAIPLEAQDESLGQWKMQHPAAHLLIVEFDVPTPSTTSLRFGRWFWRGLFLLSVAFVCILSFPKFELTAFLLLLPVGTALKIRNAMPIVQRLYIDAQVGVIEVVELFRGVPRTKTVPLLEVVSAKYVLGNAKGTRGPRIVIDTLPPFDPIVLTRIGLLKSHYLANWIERVIHVWTLRATPSAEAAETPKRRRRSSAKR